MTTSSPHILLAASPGRFRLYNTATGTTSLLAYDALTARRLLNALRSAPAVRSPVRVAARTRMTLAASQRAV